MDADSSTYTGMIADAAEASVGVELNVGHFALTPTGICGLQRMALHSGGRAFLAIAGNIGGNIEVHGSGIMVGPGICLTAAHVIDELLVLKPEGILGLSACPDGRLEIWELSTYTRVANFDLALICMRPRSDVFPFGQYLMPTLHARVPQVGERVVAIGFRQTNVDVTAGNVDLIMLSSGGVVTVNYPLGRDRVLIPGPAFEMAVEIVGGMSGGPVFDKDGRMIGLVSSSPSGDGEPRSCASLVWPVVTAEFQPIWPVALYPKTAQLRNCAPMVEVINGENVSFERRGDADYRYGLFDPEFAAAQRPERGQH